MREIAVPGKAAWPGGFIQCCAGSRVVCRGREECVGNVVYWGRQEIYPEHREM